MRVLLRSLDGLISAVILAGQEIVKLSGQKEAVLLEMMRERLKEAREARRASRERQVCWVSLTEGKPLLGGIEDAEYRLLLSRLPEHLKAPFVVGYHCGNRLGEIR